MVLNDRAGVRSVVMWAAAKVKVDCETQIQIQIEQLSGTALCANYSFSGRRFIEHTRYLASLIDITKAVMPPWIKSA